MLSARLCNSPGNRPVIGNPQPLCPCFRSFFIAPTIKAESAQALLWLMAQLIFEIKGSPIDKLLRIMYLTIELIKQLIE
jgi:hypothetical protein